MNRRKFLTGAISVMAVAGVLKGRALPVPEHFGVQSYARGNQSEQDDAGGRIVAPEIEEVLEMYRKGGSPTMIYASETVITSLAKL